MVSAQRDEVFEDRCLLFSGYTDPGENRDIERFGAVSQKIAVLTNPCPMLRTGEAANPLLPLPREYEAIVLLQVARRFWRPMHFEVRRSAQNVLHGREFLKIKAGFGEGLHCFR